MVKESMLKGVIAAALTPLDKRGKPDITAYQEHLRSLQADGCQGVLLMGTTGEGPSFSAAERQDLFTAGREAIQRAAVLACTSCASLPETIGLTRHAFEHGADAVTILPPFFFKGVDDKGLYSFYRQVLDEAVPEDGQILLYHIPQVTQVPISFDLIERLLKAAGGRVAGIKDSAGDLAHCRELCQSFPGLRVFTGNDQFILEALQAGAAGSVSGVVNLFAPLAAAIYAAFERSDPAAAGWQQALTDVWAVLERYQPYPVLLKALASVRYQEPGWEQVRPPLVEMDAGSRQAMLAALAALDLPASYAWIRTAAQPVR